MDPKTLNGELKIELALANGKILILPVKMTPIHKYIQITYVNSTGKLGVTNVILFILRRMEKFN